jgi:vacuolar-type H+-ATPase subunit F/Vma7
VSRLVVIATPALATGFRLAGCETLAADPGPAASTLARTVASAGDVGLLLVTVDLWSTFDERFRGQLERLAAPVVMPIPAGAVSGEPPRAQLLGEMLQRAIGYRIQLSVGGGR